MPLDYFTSTRCHGHQRSEKQNSRQDIIVLVKSVYMYGRLSVASWLSPGRSTSLVPVPPRGLFLGTSSCVGCSYLPAIFLHPRSVTLLPLIRSPEVRGDAVGVRGGGSEFIIRARGQGARILIVLTGSSISIVLQII